MHLILNPPPPPKKNPLPATSNLKTLPKTKNICSLTHPTPAWPLKWVTVNPNWYESATITMPKITPSLQGKANVQVWLFLTWKALRPHRDEGSSSQRLTQLVPPVERHKRYAECRKVERRPRMTYRKQLTGQYIPCHDIGSSGDYRHGVQITRCAGKRGRG